ncbi:WD repeat-containing protein [Nitzschia inconspicua]|uniref:WD repeat-containing protein n=1 Tax=Nitzschia inconspicua TaxID=303405 RepID=A0A9K3PPD0_9STRA|nr:WD repeat-containing protein [Nitzschia inconspicua]
MSSSGKHGDGKSKPYLDKIEASYQPLDFCFHPTRPNLLAAALVDGSVEIHDVQTPSHNNGSTEKVAAFSDDEDDEVDSLLSSLSLHTQRIPSSKSSTITLLQQQQDKTNNDNSTNNDKHKTTEASCRSVAFSLDGTKLFSAGSAGDLIAIDAERACTFSMDSQWQKQVLWNIQPATEGQYNPITVIRPFQTNPHLFATGDDAGGVRLWDQRVCKSWSGGEGSSLSSSSSSTPSSNKKKHNQKTFQRAIPRPPGCVLSWKEQEDYISAIQVSQDEQTLIATSADCRLGVYDLRMNRDDTHTPNFRLSDDQEDELLSLQFMKHGKKVVCGTQEGVLSIFSWGTWGDCSDRFPGHPSSIDALLKIDEDTLLTGSSDGRIRVVQVQPDKLLGVIGDDHDGFPIEKLEFNSNRHLVGSLTHSNFIKLWDATILMGDDEDNDDDEGSDADDDDDNSSNAEHAKVTVQPVKKSIGTTKHDSDDDWDDMDHDDDESDDKDDSDSDDDDSDSDKDDDDDEPVTINDKRKKRLKTENEQFFADL